AGDVGAEPHVGEDVEALDVGLGVLLRPGQHDPPGPEPGDAVVLRQAAEGEAQQVGRQGRDRDVLRVVVEDPVVELVGEDDEVAAAGDLDDARQDVPRVHGAGRVVRVDDDDGAGAVADLRLDVVEGRLPPVVLVAQVVDGRAAAEGDRRRPQRVVGGGDQHLVAVVEKRLQGHHDQFGDAVAEVDVLDVDAGDAVVLEALHDGAAGGQD